jgi:glutaminyl-peptide cyclotransferase
MRAAPLLALLLLCAGCAAPPPHDSPPPTAPPAGPPGGADLAAEARAFDGMAAWHLAAAQVADGCSPVPPGAVDLCPWEPRHRIPGSDGSNRTQAWMVAQLQQAGFRAGWHNFTATFEGRPLPGANVWGERPGRGEGLLLLGAHYDSRPCADKDPDPAKRSLPVLGANDGASGVGALLHLADLLAGRAMNLTVRIVFFDAEDMGDAGLGCGKGTPWAQGSAAYAANLTAAEVQRARGLLLLDMVGDQALELRREGHSAQGRNRALQDEVWAWAARLGHGQFRNETSLAITDDHLPFVQRGIPSVDLIHLDAGQDPFPATHHTTSDDLGHLSPASLEAVGEVVLAQVLAMDAAEGRRDRALM